jgi:6-phosphogluconolactonase
LGFCGKLHVRQSCGIASKQRRKVIQQFGKGPDKERQEASHVHSAIFSPDEKYLLEANLGTDQEHVYRFTASKNLPLTEANDSALSLKPGTGPRHIVFHPTRPLVYILGELTGTIDAYHYDSSNGALSHLQRIRTTPENFKGSPGSADIHIRGDGKFLYASNRGDANSLAVFALEKDGRLTAKQFISANGKHPRNFVIDPTNHFLLVANRDTDNIVVFKINPVTGLLKATGQEIHVPNPVCLKFFVPSL